MGHTRWRPGRVARTWEKRSTVESAGRPTTTGVGTWIEARPGAVCLSSMIPTKALLLTGVVAFATPSSSASPALQVVAARAGDSVKRHLAEPLLVLKWRLLGGLAFHGRPSSDRTVAAIAGLVSIQQPPRFARNA